MVESSNDASHYSITVKNNTAKARTVAIYQTYPGDDGNSVVWVSKPISIEGDGIF